LEDYIGKLKGKYIKNGVIVDTNLMLVLLLGYFGKESSSCSRTLKYSTELYPFINRYLHGFHFYHTTPSILTEVFNLIKPSSVISKGNQAKLVKFIEDYKETFYSSKHLMSLDSFYKFELTDTSIIKLAKEKTLLVITDDGRLYPQLQSNCIEYVDMKIVNSKLILGNR